MGSVVESGRWQEALAAFLAEPAEDISPPTVTLHLSDEDVYARALLGYYPGNASALQEHCLRMPRGRRCPDLAEQEGDWHG